MEGVLLCCVAGSRGLAVLRGVHEAFPGLSLRVSTLADAGSTDGADVAIREYAAKHELECVRWRDVVDDLDWIEARDVSGILLVGWKYLVPERILANLPRRVVVAHDSLLPRLRGFAPLATALLQGDPEVGVSVFLAEADVDTGDVAFQGRIFVAPGERIADLIERLTPLTVEGMVQAVAGLVAGRIEAWPQDESEASYSLWRDEADYFVDWNDPAERIERAIRALGPPYAGARARLGDRVVVLDAAVVEPDLPFALRQPGKVWRLSEAGEPVVVCGEGLLRLTRVLADGRDLLPLRRLRVRFS